MHKVIAIIQARMGSSRVPGKSLKKIYSVPIIEHVYNRVNAAKNVDITVVATADTEKDMLLFEYCKSKSIPVVTGSEEDVAERFNDVIKKYPAENIIRICGDQILQTPEIIEQVISEHLKFKKDYTTTGYYENRTFPLGTDVSIMKVDAFKKCYKNKHKIKAHPDNPFQYRDENEKDFSLHIVKAPKKYYAPDMRFVLDYTEDFEIITEIYNKFYDEDNLFSIDKAIDYVLENKHLLDKMNVVIKRLTEIRKERAGRIW